MHILWLIPLLINLQSEYHTNGRIKMIKYCLVIQVGKENSEYIEI